MAHVRITFSPDRTAAAARLREAISSAGYDAALVQISDLEELIASEDANRADATVLIWSRALVSAALRPGLLRKLRKQPKLIEVSADGVGPQAADGDNHVILLSGWRGQLFHPGWQRVASELQRLCGPPEEASKARLAVKPSELPAAPPPTTAGVPAAPPPAAPGAQSSNQRLRPGRLLLALLAGIGLFGAGFATSSWITNRGSGPQAQPPANMQGNDAKQVPAAGGRRIPTDAGFVGPAGPLKENSGRASLAPKLVDAGPTTASSTAAAGSPNGRERTNANARNVSKRGTSDTTKNRSPGRRESSRYSRKNSSLMRLFCQRSGRGTPECRTFLRETRRSRR